MIEGETILLRFEFPDGTHADTMTSEIPFPPPAEMRVGEWDWERVSYSSLTDEQAAACPNVMRGALYQRKAGGNG